MILKTCFPSALVAVATISGWMSETAEAQIVVGRGGGGISIGVPGLGGIRLGAPLRSRGALVAPYGSAYGYNYGDYGYGYRPYGAVTRYAARPIGSSGYAAAQSLPTAGELRAMDDGELLNAIVNLQAQLDYDLNRFDTAATWQNYLGLSADALPPASDDGRVVLGIESLSESLKRFQLTESNPQYVQISGLPSFAAMHAALAELLGRIGSAPAGAAEASVAAAEQRGAVPPAEPSPPQPSTITASPRDAYEPRSIEMRNLHAAPVAANGSTAVPEDDAAEAERPAASSGASEELPVPPPSLVGPQNESASERSIISK